eukprot:369174_1
MSKVSEKCVNTAYDILTITISIADVATDIIVLIDFYNKERMIFFWISLSILILAQCAYSMAFSLKFETEPSWDAFRACLCLLCLLPFGTFVAFCFYFNDRDDCVWFERLIDALALKDDNEFSTNSSYSKAMLFIRNKLNRHLGFLLEAVIEAFPQSLLQIVAIVVYHEANYISIISILLSMFSVMTKSLILSQGIDTYTFLWTWLCAVTDFFGIFFILTWVFYTNDSIYGEYWGYFNIFGYIWLWKFLISIASIAATGCILFILFGYWAILGLFCYHEGPWLACIWCCLGPVVCAIVAFGSCLLGEVVCFSIAAFGLYKFSTSKIYRWREKNASKVIHWMLDYISKNKNKPVGIIAVCYGMHKYNQREGNRVKSIISATNNEY